MQSFLESQFVVVDVRSAASLALLSFALDSDYYFRY